MTRGYINKVSISNYKSIEDSSFELGPLCFIVGKNASGKSNLLDALDFTADALYSDIDSAIRTRGGIASILTKSPRRPRSFRISLDLYLRSGTPAHYTFEIKQQTRADYRIIYERCAVGEASFHRSTKTVRTSSIDVTTRLRHDRLFLSSITGVREFTELVDHLTNLTIYQPDVHEMRKFQPIDNGTTLAFDGWNFASVLRRLTRIDPRRKRRIEQYLAAIAPGIKGLVAKSYGPMEAVMFGQSAVESRRVNQFFAQDMSDGTLRALSVLLALFQVGTEDEFVSLVGIEEPETGLHPSATSVIYDALRKAAEEKQIIATSHSAELLDQSDIRAESILVTRLDRGITEFHRPDSTAARMMRDELMTPGELLRRNRLEDNSIILPPKD